MGAAQRVFPVLRILDEAEAKGFYVQGLGFKVDWEWRHEPGFPLFMQVSRDGLSIFLSEYSGDCQTGGLVYLEVDDVDAWFVETQERGVEPERPPMTQPWGQREMTFGDPFGNRITIGTKVEEGEASS